MAIEAIEAIKVNGGPRGEAFGCKIFQMSCEVGYDKESSSITLNVVNESGIYPDFGDHLSYLSYHVIELEQPSQVGPDKDLLKFYMYLVKASSRTSPEAKTYTLEFVDGSHILDRVFVGTINKHTTNRDQMRTGDALFQVPVCCPDCHGDPYAHITTTSTEIQSIRQVSYATWTPIGDNINGGFVFVGVEEYTQSDCDIGNISYPIDNLIACCTNMGIKVNFPDAQIYNLFRRNHTGTLREVLRAWCSELNYTFSWDWSSKNQQINFISLNSMVTYGPGNLLRNIDNIQALIERPNKPKIGNLRPPVVLESSTSESLKETSKSYQVTFAQSSNKTASHDKTINYLTHFASVYLDDIVHAAELGKSRSSPNPYVPNHQLDLYDYSEFCTSMALSRVNPYAADIYNASKGYVGYLGYDNWITIPDGSVTVAGKKYTNLKNAILGYHSTAQNSVSHMMTEYFKKIFRLPDDLPKYNKAIPTLSNGGIPSAWFDAHIAITPVDYSPQNALPHTKEYEEEIGNSFAGRYWYSVAQPKSGRTCTKSITHDVQVSYSPSPQDIKSPPDYTDATHITTTNKFSPWYDLIGPRYGMQSFLWPQEPVASYSGTKRAVFSNTPIKVINRESKWGDKMRENGGLLEGHYVQKGAPMSEMTKDTCGNDIFEPFKPMISNLNPALSSVGTTTQRRWMRDIFDFLKKGMKNPVNHSCTKDPYADYRMDLVVCPKWWLIRRFMDVKPVMYFDNNQNLQFNDKHNPDERTYLDNVPTEGGAPDCVPHCDVQRSMITAKECDCNESIFTGPGDLSSQTSEFQNHLFSPQSYPHPHGIYTKDSFAVELSFLRNNPWKDFAFHNGTYDTTLSVRLPVGTFRRNVDKLPYRGLAGMANTPTDASWNVTDWYRSNFSEKISITYQLPKETSVMNSFEILDSQGRNTNLPKNVARINVQETDVTSQLQIIDGNCGGSPQVINIYLPNVGFVTMEDYHNLYTKLLSTGSEFKRKTVSATFAGLNIGTDINKYIHPMYGLTSLSTSMSSEGYQTQISWANKPISYPSMELQMVALKPNLIRQVYI